MTSCPVLPVPTTRARSGESSGSARSVDAQAAAGQAVRTRVGQAADDIASDRQFVSVLKVRALLAPPEQVDRCASGFR